MTVGTKRKICRQPADVPKLKPLIDTVIKYLVDLLDEIRRHIKTNLKETYY